MTPVLFDTIVGIVIILSVVVAFFRGFVKEILTIVNLVGASVAAWYLGDDLAPPFQSWLAGDRKPGEEPELIFGVVPPEVMGSFLAYAAVFFGVFIILSLAGMAISGSVKALGLGPLDKTLGMVFGAARGFLLVFLLYLPFAYFMPPEDHDYPEWVTESVSFIGLDKTYAWLDEYLGDPEGEDAEDGDGEKKRGPISTRLKKMGDDLMREKQQAEEKAAEARNDLRDATQDLKEDARELRRDILTDEEKQAP